MDGLNVDVCRTAAKKALADLTRCAAVRAAGWSAACVASHRDHLGFAGMHMLERDVRGRNRLDRPTAMQQVTRLQHERVAAAGRKKDLCLAVPDDAAEIHDVRRSGFVPEPLAAAAHRPDRPEPTAAVRMARIRLAAPGARRARAVGVEAGRVGLGWLYRRGQADAAGRAAGPCCQDREFDRGGRSRATAVPTSVMASASCTGLEMVSFMRPPSPACQR